MAAPGYVRSLLGGVPADLRRVLGEIFEFVLGNLRLGRPEHQTRSENFQLYFLEATTPSTANTEFTIAHGLGRAPYLLLPVLPLNAVGAQIVPLTVTRAADAHRLYLKSSVVDAPITILVEG